MKKLTEINLKFAVALIGFFSLIIFIAAFDYLVEIALKPFKTANVEYLYSSIVGLIVMSGCFIIARIAIEIYKNLKR